MDQENFFIYLKKHYPHLYMVEEQVKKLQDESGFGTVFIELTMQKNIIYKYSANRTSTGMLVGRDKNEFDTIK